MSPIVMWLTALIAIAITTALAVLNSSRARTRRLGLFNRCLDDFEGTKVSLTEAGFPRLSLQHKGSPLLAELIPDTLTIRRLPQLWLSVTHFAASPGRAGFAILNRPSGNDYYSLTNGYQLLLEPPRELPQEILVRGSSEQSQQLLYNMASSLAEIFADPRVKEIAVTERGLRIVTQCAQGRRGEHLLLRQAVFDDAVVGPELLRTCVAQLDALRCAWDFKQGKVRQ